MGDSRRTFHVQVSLGLIPSTKVMSEPLINTAYIRCEITALSSRY